MKELKSFLGSIQHLSKFINNLSKKTDRIRQLLKKEVKWDWTSEIDEDFKKLKKEITKAPCLAHFDPRKDNYITTDACNTRLGATLWQKEGETFRPVAFASRFLTDCEKSNATNELEILGALWEIEYFCIRKKSKPIKRPPSAPAITKKELCTQAIQCKIDTLVG